MAEYTVDEANKEIMRRARLLNPSAFSSAPGPFRVVAVRQASDEFFAEGNTIITEDETKC